MRPLTLTSDQRRYLLREQVLVPALVNLVFNAVVGWLIFQHALPVRMWPDLTWLGLLQPNFAGDVGGMFFFLPFVTCLVVNRFVRGAVREGKVSALTIRASDHRWLRHLPASVWWRATLLGAVCSAVPGSLVVLALTVAGASTLSLGVAVALKGVLAALLAALITPVIALYALASER